jgi:hypothetical protein
MRGKFVSKKEIDTPFGKVAIVRRDYKTFIHRNKVIFYLGEGDATLLGKVEEWLALVDRENPFAPVKYETKYYIVYLNENADAHEVLLYRMLEEEIPDAIKEGLTIDTKDELDELIEGLKCKPERFGQAYLDTKKEFDKWVKIGEIAKEIPKRDNDASKKAVN